MQQLEPTHIVCCFDVLSKNLAGVALQDELSGWEPAPAPLWGTFCGHLEGEWLGQYAAYTPWGGEDPLEGALGVGGGAALRDMQGGGSGGAL
jgi:hypothetical protein